MKLREMEIYLSKGMHVSFDLSNKKAGDFPALLFAITKP